MEGVHLLLNTNIPHNKIIMEFTQKFICYSAFMYLHSLVFPCIFVKDLKILGIIKNILYRQYHRKYDNLLQYTIIHNLLIWK